MNSTKKKLPALALLLDECRGTHIPKDFVTGFDLTQFSGISAYDIETCSNLDNDGYWDAWNDILDNAVVIKTGHRLYQDGALWAINYDEITDQEYKDFFGEEKS